MLVDVVCMRRRGQKLAREQLQAEQPVRGELGLSAIRPGWYQGKRDPPLMAWLVHPERMDHLLPSLDPARVTRISSKGMVIIGMEEVHLTFKRNVTAYPQAWWVRPAAGPMPETPQVREPRRSALLPVSNVPLHSGDV